MKLQILAISFAALSSGVSAGCAYNEYHWNCEWHGSSPSCGGTSHDLGYTDADGWELVKWSKDADIKHLRSSLGYCAGSYGSSCWSGYKRLWCKSNVQTDYSGQYYDEPM
ncbi:hypothetical protein N7516_009370 [Penicillium verrucosum]|uniref:uncharacterized protein n=1 Tax=Penicillium verrucosum TaxID=60171 RepID=UPI0025457CFD|nr:uncharacterized protein N7516_009370 [Penicillium verrucosum]KAJ5927597.1 hypothetical protein N7516_009370 [Penicillium verrucosum]